MNWYKNSQLNIPNILYHATYGANLESIMEKGIIPRYFCVWADCENGVFLANDPHEAASYPETTDNPEIPEEYFDDIIIFAIDVNKLDKSKLLPDPHVKWNENPNNSSTWIYKGIIHPSAFIKIINE